MEPSFETILKRTLRIPFSPTETCSAFCSQEEVTRLDAALMGIGFKLTAPSVDVLQRTSPDEVVRLGQRILPILSTMVGNHHQHVPYIATFPSGVPSTPEYYMGVFRRFVRGEDILSPAHTYEDVFKISTPLMGVIQNAFKLITIGGSIKFEMDRLYLQLLESTVPLSESDRAILTNFSEECAAGISVEDIPMRENRAIHNASLVRMGALPSVTHPTDILRLAAVLSGGDPSLVQKVQFKSFPRRIRRVLLSAIRDMMAESRSVLDQIPQYAEMWKRLGERLHPHEFKNPDVTRWFAVARGEETRLSLSAKVEAAFQKHDIACAMDLLSSHPGMLFRNMDRLVLAGVDTQALLNVLQGTLPRVSTRVILSVIEHLMNRTDAHPIRVFPTRTHKMWVQPDDRKSIPSRTVSRILDVLHGEILHRTPTVMNLTVDPEIKGLAVPLTEKASPRGCGILPRGSIRSITPGTNVVRFFCFWEQREHTTDYDLSLHLLNRDFKSVGQVSWTNLRDMGITHSGDVREAPHGASEFIDVNLSSLSDDVDYIVPQVNMFAGEDFNHVKEAFFGVMERPNTSGLPFEPRTVTFKSELSGDSKIALPLVLIRPHDDVTDWTVKMINLYPKGSVCFNRVETNRVSTSLLVSGVVCRTYLNVGYLTDILEQKAVTDDSPIETYVGMASPPVATSISPRNLSELLPPDRV